MRPALLLVAALALGACAGAEGKRYTVTPETQVVVRGGRRPAEANYRAPPPPSDDAARGDAKGGAGK